MQTIKNKFEQNYGNIFQNRENEDKNLENTLGKAKEIQSPEIPKIFDQMELAHICPFIPKDRKASYDSVSVCASQADTLSQTSESSFFLSYTNPNSQQVSTNELIQIENKPNKEIPFFYGVEEYFRKLMPEKFTEYTETKNYKHKKSCLKKDNQNKKEKNCQENIQMQNYFYYPIVYCPINTFYFNHFQSAIINNSAKEENENREKDKTEKDKVIKNEIKENKEITRNSKEKDKKKEESKVDKKIEIIPKIEIEVDTQASNLIKKKGKNRNKNFYQKNNFKKNKNNFYKNTYSQRNFQNNNRQYNKYSTNFYENEYFQEERTSYYNNNHYHKKRYQRPFENNYYNFY